MKSRFTTLDVFAGVAELQRTVVGMRLHQAYDVDNKTYLLRLAQQEEKVVVLFESGIRFHTTSFSWPKNMAPSGFSMKLRKHLRNKRVESIKQLGIDRVIDIQFGSSDAAYHLIVELYDKGNVVLTDYEYTILNILRPRAIGDEDVKLIVREKYPITSARQAPPSKTLDEVREIIAGAKQNENIKKVLLPHVYCGAGLLEHALLGQGIPPTAKVGSDITADTSEKIFAAFNEIEEIIKRVSTDKDATKGVLIQKAEKNAEGEQIFANQEFHPFLLRQHAKEHHVETNSFMEAVDTFFSTLEEQKGALKQLQQEKQALKKLDNIKLDHEKRLVALANVQKNDVRKAELIEINIDLVEKALAAVRAAVATQMDWNDIKQLIQDAKSMGDPVAKHIESLNFEKNRFTMKLGDPYDEEVSEENVDIHIEESAYANARRYFDQKRTAAKKEQKTLDASAKAFKSAERKTKEMLKQAQITTQIAKQRKSFWFEKFFWFISSENYVVVGGRDAQQNELLVKRYLRPGDVYVHADLHGASSVIIKNYQKGQPIPPKTLNEAGTMAMCYSSAWQAKIITAVWWVYDHQVSKTAPTGEYLTPGSFMIRGKKNYLSPPFLQMGFAYLFKLDDCSIARHEGERRIRTEEAFSASTSVEETQENEIEVEMSTDDEDEGPSMFPDTQAKVVTFAPPVTGGVNTAIDIVEDQDEDNAAVIVGSQQQRVKQNKGNTVAGGKKKGKQQKNAAQQPVANSQNNKTDNSAGFQQPKRMSKAKMRKIKEKYKHQDDEERELRMKILASAGNKTKTIEAVATTEQDKDEPNESSNDCNQDQGDVKSKGSGKSVQIVSPKTSVKGSKKHDHDDTEVKSEPDAENKEVDAEIDDDDDIEDDDPTASLQQEQKLLATLTGCPVADDVLLFAVPVVAPYSTVQSYKYKVKITPGATRRGKAAKTAIEIFARDKAATQRERDLVRATKDQDVARNMPGTVKLTAPSMSKK